MEFYQRCLGGQLDFQTVGDQPGSTNLPKEIKDSVVLASLKTNQLVLMGTDMVGSEGLKKGNAISILLNCTTEQELNKFYSSLAGKNKDQQPIERTYWGDLFGGITDPFGHRWLFYLKQ